MILIPRFKDLYAIEPISMGACAKGEFKITMRDENGNFQYETDWKPNVITNGGLNNVGTNGTGWISNMVVGSGTTPAAFTDTALQTQLGTSVGVNGVGWSTLGAPTYGVYVTNEARFLAGNGTGTINEIGLGVNSTDLSIRALVTPGIVKGASQIMDITHRHYAYRDTIVTAADGGTDITGVINISGVDYNYTLRAGEVTYGPNYCFGGLGQSGYTRASSSALPYSNVVPTWNNGDLFSWSVNHSSYTPGNYYATVNVSCDINNVNNPLGIRLIMITDLMQSDGGGSLAPRSGWMIRFGKVSDDTTIPKDADRTFTLTVRRHWRRYP